MALTALGKRTLAGFRKRFGKDGDDKFDKALERGTIDASKMRTGGAADNPRPYDTSMPVGDGDSAEPPAEPMGNITRAAARGAIAGVDTTDATPNAPNPTKPGKRRIPTGLARAASGSFQRRPG
jgi:hypothetical protein